MRTRCTKSPTRTALHCPFCSRGEDIDVRLGPKPALKEDALTKWMDEHAAAAIAPATQEIKDEATDMWKNNVHVLSRSLKCSFGKTWWNLFKKRNKVFVSRLAQNMESQRAAAKLSADQRKQFFNETLRPALENLSHDPACIGNEDESGFMRNFSTVGQRVWVRRRRRFVARRRGWQRQHVTAIVAVNAQGQSVKPSLLWHHKQVRVDMFLKAACPVSIKGTAEGWSSQETFLGLVEKVLVAETQPVHNRYKCILLLIDGVK